MSASADIVTASLLAPLAELGVDLESVEVQKAGRRHVVRIVVDKDGGVDLDLVAEVSHRASELLDLPPLCDELPGPFVLEVTSPGVDRPLTEPRHWRRALLRLVHVTRHDGTEVDGRLIAVPSDADVVLSTADGDLTLPLAEVSRALVQVEFNRTDATQTVGRDEQNEDETDKEAE